MATLSNGHVALLVDLARHGDLRFDALLSAELARVYKPAPEVYRAAARLLGVEPAELMLVAAHPCDLEGARPAGLRTAFVDRPLELRPGLAGARGPGRRRVGRRPRGAGRATDNDSSLKELKSVTVAGMELPPIVAPEEWQRANEALLAKEKAATRERDALAAERRRQPMMEFSTGYEFEGPTASSAFPDLFEGRPQLIVYHFWLPPDGDPCGGCSMFTDQVSELAHLNARGVDASRSSRARRRTQIAALKRRMGWEMPWYTVRRRGVPEGAAGRASTSRCTSSCATATASSSPTRRRGRGVEALGSVWTFLDLTPLGRQEEWEDTPPGRPQSPPYQWWRLHDSYASA